MNDFEEDRSKISGLHFSQDRMRPHERDTLHLAEAMMRRCQTVLDLCADSRRNSAPLAWTVVRAAITGEDPTPGTDD